jgi:hypothetical protein
MASLRSSSLFAALLADVGLPVGVQELLESGVYFIQLDG